MKLYLRWVSNLELRRLGAEQARQIEERSAEPLRRLLAAPPDDRAKLHRDAVAAILNLPSPPPIG